MEFDSDKIDHLSVEVLERKIKSLEKENRDLTKKFQGKGLFFLLLSPSTFCGRAYYITSVRMFPHAEGQEIKPFRKMHAKQVQVAGVVLLE